MSTFLGLLYKKLSQLIPFFVIITFAEASDILKEDSNMEKRNKGVHFQTTINRLPLDIFKHLESFLSPYDILNFSSVNKEITALLREETELLKPYFKHRKIYKDFVDHEASTLNYDWFIYMGSIGRKEDHLLLRDGYKKKYMYCKALQVMFENEKEKLKNIPPHHSGIKEIYKKYRQSLILYHLEYFSIISNMKSYDQVIDNLYIDTRLQTMSTDDKHRPQKSFFYSKILTRIDERGFYKLAYLLRNSIPSYILSSPSISLENYDINHKNLGQKEYEIGESILYVLAARDNLKAQYLLRCNGHYISEDFYGMPQENNPHYYILDDDGKVIFFSAKSLADKGYSKAQFNIGKEEEHKGNFEEALGYYKKAANQNYRGALRKIRIAEEASKKQGEELCKDALKFFNSDQERSFKYAEAAALKYNNTNAFNILGAHYEKQNNFDEAFKVYSKGIELHSKYAMLNLALLVEKHPDQFRKYIEDIEILRENGKNEYKDWIKFRKWLRIE